MEWKKSSISGAGFGVFAGEFITKGSCIRVMKHNQNLIVLKGPEDVPPLTGSSKFHIPTCNLGSKNYNMKIIYRNSNSFCYLKLQNSSSKFQIYKNFLFTPLEYTIAVLIMTLIDLVIKL